METDKSRSKLVKDSAHKPPAAGKGRPKGAKNKLSRSIKEAFAFAFEGIGGEAALIEWAEGHKTDFYKILARFQPRSVELDKQNNDPYVVRIIDLTGFGDASSMKQTK